MNHRIYFDHNATTPMHPEVLDAMLPFFREKFGNASSVHAFGRETRYALEVAREKIADFFKAEAEEILFTSGGTEANNLGIKGWMRKHKPGAHMITSAIEHSSVLRVCQQLEEEGFQVTYLPVDQQGQVDVKAVEEAITEKTVLISLMHANNEVGTVEPVEAIGALARECGICFHTDAIQSAGKIPVNVKGMKADLLSVSAHKIAGPKGVGFLFKRVGVDIHPEIVGGAHERNQRAGTENVALIVGFAKAVEILAREMEKKNETVCHLRNLFERELKMRIPEAHIMATEVKRLPNTSGICFEGVEGGSIMRALDLEGIAVSTGSACMSGAVKSSHVLKAMGIPEALAVGAVRFSFGSGNTEMEVQKALGCLAEILPRIQGKTGKPLR